MTNEPVTYQQLDTVLSRLGFTRQRVEPKWLRYEHRDTDTVIILVEKKPGDLVRITDAVSARLHLVEKGLVSEKELDKLLSRTASAEPSASSKKE